MGSCPAIPARVRGAGTHGILSRDSRKETRGLASANGSRRGVRTDYLQVEQDFEEQDVQLPEFFRRLEPPPIPNDEWSFRISRPPQEGQTTSPSRPSRTSVSNVRSQARQTNS